MRGRDRFIFTWLPRPMSNIMPSMGFDDFIGKIVLFATVILWKEFKCVHPPDRDTKSIFLNSSHPETENTEGHFLGLRRVTHYLFTV